MNDKTQVQNLHPDYVKMEKSLVDIIKDKGFEQVDNRLKRVTRSLPGHFVVVGSAPLLEWLRKQKLLEKYKDDSKRMYVSFKRAILEAKKDKNSRRLMVFNDSKFSEVNECFTHFQFVYTHRNEFDMYVYQRSSDIGKLLDDMIFFAHQMERFEQRTGYYVTKLVVIFGHIHYQI